MGLLTLLNRRSVASNPVFAPTDIAGLVVWLKADTLALNDGDPVTTWADQSGSGNDLAQATASLKPTYQTNEINGRPIVQADGSDDEMETAGSLTLKPVTVVFVARPTNFTNYRTIFGSGTDGGLQIRFTQTTGTVHTLAQSTAAIATSTGTAVAATPIMVAFSYSAVGAYVFRLDGAADSSGTNDQTITAEPIILLNHGTAPGGEPFIGGLGELLIYDSVLAEADIISLETYLNGRWAVF